jgi:broad-specificity NMP kinase
VRVDVTNKEVDKVVEEIVNVLNNVKECEVWVDWLSNEALKDFITELLNTS